MKKMTVGAVLWGVLSALAVSLMLSAAAAALAGTGTLPAGALKYAAWLVSLLAGLVGGFFTAKQAGKQRLPLALAAAGIYLLLIFVLRGLIFRSVSSQPWWIPVWTVAGAVIGALWASKKGKKRSPAKRLKK